MKVTSSGYGCYNIELELGEALKITHEADYKLMTQVVEDVIEVSETN